MKKTLLAMALLASTVTYADPSSVQILPLEQMGLPHEDVTHQKNAIYGMKRLGYREKETVDPREYFSLQDKNFKFSKENELDPYGTDIKRNLSNIKLSFNFKGVGFIPKQDTYGYVVMNTYNTDKKYPEGWTGVMQFFNYPKIGVCSYSVTYTKPANSMMILNKDLVTREIRGLPTEIYVIGNKHDGLMYTVKWYTDDYWHSVDCANQNFSVEIKKEILELAKKIDREATVRQV
jgi:hypothetical protein